ncbi:hypothetical protein M8J76_009633 [Diaphorina citri]|jgi:Uncharacterized protein containing DHHC-type Zn finger|nr:hypothetical protein M8J76_009633 [Diaphorina citri]KAI5754986.1 hypothetical protein M8J77_013169 [Diaphorina citri]
MLFRLIRSIPLLTAVLVICYSYCCYIFLYCDKSLNEQEPLTFFLLHYILFLFVWSYYKTTTTPPPPIPPDFFLSAATMNKIWEADENCEKIDAILVPKARRLPIYTYTTGGYIRYCQECAIIKPDRTHHCRVCGQCILKMDHHCPWLHNCMSFSNYKFYILFLAYGAIYCVIMLSILPIELYKYWWQDKVLDEALLYHYTILSISAVIFFAILIALFSYHIYLVLNNRTTLEAFRAPLFSYGQDKNGFSLGKRNNFLQVFGDKKWKWFFPVFSSLGCGWSFDFPKKNDIEAKLKQEEDVPTDNTETE